MALFAKEEYLDRLRQTKARMNENGIDVLVSSDPANMNYLTGYDGWSFYVPQCVVVSLTDETPLWIGRKMDVAGARHTTFLPDSHIIGYPEHYVQTPARHPMNFVGDMVAERGWGKQTIGVDTHVARLAQRLGLSDKKDPDKIEADLTNMVSGRSRVKFCHLLQFHGRRVCQAKKPDCPNCPINKLCTYPDKPKS